MDQRQRPGPSFSLATLRLGKGRYVSILTGVPNAATPDGLLPFEREAAGQDTDQGVEA